MQKENNPIAAGATPENGPINIGSHSRWARGAALVWVVVLCFLAGGAGLALAAYFSAPTPVSTIPDSFSGY